MSFTSKSLLAAACSQPAAGECVRSSAASRDYVCCIPSTEEDYIYGTITQKK